MWTNCLQVLTAFAPMAVVGEAPTWKGSGDVVEDCFHWILQ